MTPANKKGAKGNLSSGILLENERNAIIALNTNLDLDHVHLSPLIVLSATTFKKDAKNSPSTKVNGSSPFGTIIPYSF